MNIAHADSYFDYQLLLHLRAKLQWLYEPCMLLNTKMFQINLGAGRWDDASRIIYVFTGVHKKKRRKY